MRKKLEWTTIIKARISAMSPEEQHYMKCNVIIVAMSQKCLAFNVPCYTVFKCQIAIYQINKVMYCQITIFLGAMLEYNT